jgi:hypothetical protein
MRSEKCEVRSGKVLKPIFISPLTSHIPPLNWGVGVAEDTGFIFTFSFLQTKMLLLRF